MTAKINPVKFDIRATDKTKNAFRSVQGSMRATKAAMAGVVKSLFSMKAGFVLLAGVTGIGLLVRASLKATDELGKMSKTLGISVGNLAALRHAADLGGTSFNTFAKAAKTLSVNGFDFVTKGTGLAKEAFDELGITVADVNGTNGDTIKLLGLVADKLNTVDAGTTKTALAYKLLGGRAVELLPALEGGSAALEDYRKEADRLGLALSGNAVQGVEEANDAMTRLGALFQGVRDQVVSAMAPAITRLTDLIRINLLEAIEASGGSVETWAKGVALDIIDMTTVVVEHIGKFALAAESLAVFFDKDFKGSMDGVKSSLGGALGAMRELRAEVIKGNKEIKKGHGPMRVTIGGAKALTEVEKDAAKVKDKLISKTQKYRKELRAISKANKNGFLSTEQYRKALRMTTREFHGVSTAVEDTQDKIAALRNDMAKGAIAQDEGTAALRRYELQLVKAQAAQENTFGAGARAGMANYFDELNNKGAQGADFMVNSVFKPMENALTTFYRTGKMDFKSFKDAVLDGLASMAAKATISFAGSVASSFAGAAGSAVGSSALKYVSSFFASGGSVSGPGTGTSDSIPAMLSNGEYVINADAASKIGVGNLNALNSGRVRGFASGGQVSAAEAAFEGAQGRFGGVSVSESSQGVGPGLGSNIEGNTVFGKTTASQLQQIQDLVQSLPKGTQAHKNALATQAELQGSFFAMGLPSPMSTVVSIMSKVVGAALRAGMDVDFVGGPAGPNGDAQIQKTQAKGMALAGEAQRMMGGAVGGLGGKFNDNMLNLVSKVDAMRSQPIPRADGGPMLPGKPYRVGERGTEVITPGAAGIVQQTPSSDPTGSKSIVHEIRELRGEMSALTRTISRLVAGQPNAGMRFA
jgi:hypothetical protein